MPDITANRPAGRVPLAEAERLLSRYPHVSEDEARRIRRFMRTAPSFEIALLTSRDHLQAPLERFRDDHHGAFDVDWKKLALFWIYIVLVFFVVGSLWLLLR